MIYTKYLREIFKFIVLIFFFLKPKYYSTYHKHIFFSAIMRFLCTETDIVHHKFISLATLNKTYLTLHKGNKFQATGVA